MWSDVDDGRYGAWALDLDLERQNVMFKKIAVVASAAGICRPRRIGGLCDSGRAGRHNTRGTSSGGHMSHGMHHMKMKHHTMMKHHMRSGHMPGSKNL